MLAHCNITLNENLSLLWQEGRPAVFPISPALSDFLDGQHLVFPFVAFSAAYLAADGRRRSVTDDQLPVVLMNTWFL